ncbi:MucBP domain-containing protein [Vagococcus entomophilus]|uniref:Gram-positive cocci surface proteins LPxTG domain-containing protein n=1 Tax=Vagococcus entomophilus TaxID=1160095 RepID=A0A430AGN2_9ENTE|nr:MucBP domain-containing protein [Vagococcus entomophilus]RSU07089.1 hypothetical protein CBF30_07480 [Vagococcus entomophilus]
MKKYVKICLIVMLLVPNILFILEPKAAYADSGLDNLVSQAKNASKQTVTEEVKKLITTKSEQHISTVSTPLNNLFSYKAGETKKYTEGGPTWGKEAFVISSNPIYTTDGVDTNLLKIDFNRPGSGTTNTSPSSISITAKTNKKIDTSFWLEVRSVYVVWHTYKWETFSGSEEKTWYSQDLLDNPVSIRVHVTKDNEEGTVKVSYTDIDTGESVINDNTLYGKIGTSFDKDVTADYEAKKEYIQRQFYQYVGEKNTHGNYMDGTVQAEYQFERIQGGDITVNHVNNDTSLNDKQKAAFGTPKSDTLSGKYGETKVAKAQSIPHYETIDGKVEKPITLNENPQQVTFEYKLSQAKPVTVKYVDQDGKPIAGVDNKLVTGRWGDEYTVVPREEIPFYTLIDSAEPIKGELTDEAQEIVYHYQVAEGAPVEIHYLDEDGKKLKKDKTLSGLKFGQQFTEKAIEIEHYQQKNDEITGQITDKKQEITFVYTKNGGKPVRVDFQDETGNLINESYLLNGKYNEAFDVSESNTDVQDILTKITDRHYQLTNKAGDVTGKFTDDAAQKYSSHVIYKFNKKMAPGKIKVRYLNSQTNKEIADSDTLTGKYDETYTSQPKIIKDYHLTKIPENSSGTFGEKAAEVVYLYEPNVGGTVELNYISKETKKPIATTDVKSGGVNQDYQFEAKSIPHYVVTTIPTNATGVYPAANKVINVYFEYDRAKAKPVHVVYQDEKGKILGKEELSGENKKWNDSFQTEIKSFEGYEIKKIEIDGKEVAAGNGLYDDEKAQTVVYTYKLKKAAPVLVKYIDIETQKEISAQDTVFDQDAVYGDQFQSQAKDIKQYIYKQAELNQKVQEGPVVSGKYTDYQQTLVYYYVKDKTSIKTKSSQIYVGDKWRAEDNFDSATDKEGNPVDFKAVTVEGTVDTSKAGTYEITYNYNGISSIAKIKVKDVQTAVNVHDSTIYVGDKWRAEDNFDSAVDREGNRLAFKDISVNGEFDTSKVGTYEVFYSYDGVTVAVKITVKAAQTAINVHDSTIYEGDKWRAEDNFDSAIDKAGEKVAFKELIVTGSVDTKKAGSYEISYVYQGMTSVARVTVKPRPQPDPSNNQKKEERQTKKPIKTKTKQSNLKGSNSPLPKTGEQETPMFTLIGAAILSLIPIFVFKKSKLKN